MSMGDVRVCADLPKIKKPIRLGKLRVGALCGLPHKEALNVEIQTTNATARGAEPLCK